MSSISLQTLTLKFFIQGNPWRAKVRHTAEIKVPVCLIIGLRGLACEDNLYQLMGWEFSDVVRCHLGPLLQGQLRIAKLESAYKLHIIGPRGLHCETSP